MCDDYSITPQEAYFCTLACMAVSRAALGTTLGNEAAAAAAWLDKARGGTQEKAPPDVTRAMRNVLMAYGMLAGGYKEAWQKRFGAGVLAEAWKSATKLAGAAGRYATKNGISGREVAAAFQGPRQPRARKLYIADCHFFHNGLNQHMDCRGFQGWEEMNAHMESCWNRNVTGKDEVFILGDFSIARGNATNELLHRLNGKKYLVVGNHDDFLSDKAFDRSLFVWVRPYAEIRDGGRRVVLSHYPVFCYNGQYKTLPDWRPETYMLYGHVPDCSHGQARGVLIAKRSL